MNKHTITLTLLTAIMSSSSLTADAWQNTENQIVTDSISCHKEDRLADCKVIADYPKNCNTPLGRAITEHINKTLGIHTDGSITDAENKVVASVDSAFAATRGQASELRAAGLSIYAPFAASISVRKKSENKLTVTYATDIYAYTGGAHGMAVYKETVFIKASGKIIDEGIFKDTSSAKFKRLIINGLKKYFNAADDAELKDYLLLEGDLKDLPLPAASTPSFTDKGVKFIYQQYEIAPYAAGMPEAIIPYDTIKAFVKDEFLKILPQ